ncbi:MAG: type II toxin-antitoxin system VapC family toxin [Candidatus Thorarchaeota archaeon]
MNLRFIDASTFLYAVLEPIQELPEHLRKMKSEAREIITRVDKGEEVVTSVVHLSEVASVLETRKSFSEAAQFIYDLLAKETIRVLDVTHSDYQGAAVLAQRYKVGINDSLAKILMDRLKVKEIYSFDKHFDNFSFNRIMK